MRDPANPANPAHSANPNNRAHTPVFPHDREQETTMISPTALDSRMADSRTAPDSRTALHISGVDLEVVDGSATRRILDDVSLDVNRGEIVAVTGPDRKSVV